MHVAAGVVPGHPEEDSQRTRHAGYPQASMFKKHTAPLDDITQAYSGAKNGPMTAASARSLFLKALWTSAKLLG